MSIKLSIWSCLKFRAQDDFTIYDVIYQFFLEVGRVQNILKGLKIQKFYSEK